MREMIRPAAAAFEKDFYFADRTQIARIRWGLARRDDTTCPCFL